MSCDATRNAASASGTPQYTEACISTARISSLVTPLVSAPLTCDASSWCWLMAVSMAKLSILRVLNGRVVSPQISPQQYSVTSFCMGLLNSSAPSHDFRSEEHTSELQSLMRISYAVFCLKKKKNTTHEQ